MHRCCLARELLTLLGPDYALFLKDSFFPALKVTSVELRAEPEKRHGFSSLGSFVIFGWGEWKQKAEMGSSDEIKNKV